MKTMFNTAMNIFRHSCQIPLSLMEQFSAVNITDSTGLSLPEALSDDFPGSGGSASKSALKLQLVVDFLTGCFKTITLTDGITPDQRYREHIQIAEQNSLNLFDLGYFTVESLKAFAEKGAYFLCRLLHGTGIYTSDGTKVNLLQLLRTETQDRFELEIHHGAKILFKCRLCCFRTPEKVANIRRRNAIKQATKKGRTPCKESLELMGWTIFVTNVPSTMLLLEHIALLYSVRWQIELIFKLWKSHMAIHIIAGFRKERILTELYAKLIGLVLFQYVAMPLRSQNIDLSPTKIFKRFIRRIELLTDALKSLKHLIIEIERICSAMLKYGKREKRKKTYQPVKNCLRNFAIILNLMRMG